MKDTLEIPEGVSVVVTGKAVKVTGPLGTLERDYAFMPLVKFSNDAKTFTLNTPRERKHDKMFLNTAKAHVSNMIVGVTKGFKYKLEIVHVHFPIRVNIQGNDLIVENFVGSKVPRKSWKHADVKVEVKGSSVFVEGMNKEHVGQTSANLEQLTHIRSKDRRIFRDGIYLVERGNINE
ncbi:MAG: 50S ribosomal protein L6 [Candidatus Altiarchaeota archaeon]|nr:50S ribosomal protein L6 [Candidatus Altiarchaeota archaeon]